MRLDALLVRLGLGSRTAVQKLVRAGHVTVENAPVRDPGLPVGESAAVSVDGRALDTRLSRTLMLHKPTGVLTAARDPGCPTVMDLLPPVYRCLQCMPVGRLDKDTSGLLLMTTDGELAHRLISPKREIEKVYLAETDTGLTPADAAAFAAGLDLGDFVALPARLEILADRLARITVTEGKFHQVRRMLAACGHQTVTLCRRRVGPLSLDEALPPGAYRELTEHELHMLREAVNLT